MDELEVDCIQRARPGARHEQITHLGHSGFACRIPVDRAIQQIRGEVSSFYLLDKPSRTRIAIAVRREAGKAPYLQALVGGVWTDHLLALPECRPSFRLIR